MNEHIVFNKHLQTLINIKSHLKCKKKLNDFKITFNVIKTFKFKFLS